ncbi:MAG: hypothetical protein IJW37_06285 [Lachnospiraceae bacterium]|nr:hypothetical protein [Lachnospiraceae bacterium]
MNDSGDFLNWSMNKNNFYRFSGGLVTYYREENRIKMSEKYKEAYVKNGIFSYSYDVAIEEEIK